MLDICSQIKIAQYARARIIVVKTRDFHNAKSEVFCRKKSTFPEKLDRSAPDPRERFTKY